MILLFFHQPAVHCHGDHLPRNELSTLPECLFRRHLQPAAAGYLHPHDGDALNVVFPDDLRQLFGIVHAIQLGAAHEGDVPLDKPLMEGGIGVSGAVGGNEQSALMMGLNVRRVKLKAYVLDGFLCGVGGILFCLNTLGGFVEQAKGFEMDAIASSVIGGTLLTGGVGNVIGTLFGVLIKATIEAFITFQGTLSSWWTRITIAALLCFFIVLQSVLAMIKKKD